MLVGSSWQCLEAYFPRVTWPVFWSRRSGDCLLGADLAELELEVEVEVEELLSTVKALVASRLLVLA